jgi:importin-7
MACDYRVCRDSQCLWVRRKLTIYTAVVYLKNRITRGWAEENALGHKPIPADERKPFRDRILPVLASSQPQIRAQLVPILQTILQHDFPKKWPDYMDITLQLINTNDANSVFAGLQCLLSVCRTYRFKAGEERADLDKIVTISFTSLLNIGSRLVDENSLEAAEMLRMLIKCYKHTIYVSGSECAA